MRKLLPILISFLFVNSLLAQVPDSIQQIIETEQAAMAQLDSILVDSLKNPLLPDSTQKEKKRFIRDWIKSDYPNPKKAALLSVIPGGGQIYNKRFWKLPIVYAAYGGIGYLLVDNLNKRKSFNEAYALRLELFDATPCSTNLCQQIFDSRLSTESIKARRQAQLKNLQLSYIGVVAVTILAAADAFVDGHLKTFNVDDDLSFKLKPTFDSSPLGWSTGIGLVVNF